MKSITLFFLTVFAITLTSNAQITQGNWLVGGTGSFNSTKVKDDNGIELSNSHGVRLRPNIGYFFYNKIAAGLIGQFDYGNVKNGSSNTGFGLGPFARFYFLETEKLINIFMEGSYIHFSENGNSFSFKAGPVLYFNNSVGLELTLGYNSTKFSGDYQSNDFRIALGFQIHLEK